MQPLASVVLLLFAVYVSGEAPVLLEKHVSPVTRGPPKVSPPNGHGAPKVPDGPRPPVVAGPLVDLALDDANALKYAHFAVEEYGKEKETTAEVVELLKAQSQEVAGTRYDLEVKAKIGGVEKKCEFEVLDPPKKLKDRLIYSSCV